MDEVRAYEASDSLSAAQKAALRLHDAFLLHPGHVELLEAAYPHDPVRVALVELYVLVFADMDTDEVCAAVIEQVRGILRSPEIIVRTWRVARRSIEGLTEADVREALERLDPLWDELFPAEQARIVQLLVERVDIGVEGADIRLRTQGLTSLVADLNAIQQEKRRAA